MTLTEGKLLERAVVGLGVKEEDNDELESDPAAVDGQEAPLDGGDGDRVDVVGEETGKLAEDLLNTDTTRARGIGPELDKVGVSEGVVANVVGGRVGEVEEHSGNAGGLVLNSSGISSLDPLKTNGVTNEHQKHHAG